MAEKVCLQLLCPNVDHQPKIRHFLDHGIGYNWTIYPWYLLCLHCSYKSTSYGWRRALDEISKDAASCLDCLARSFYLTSLLLMVWWYDTYFYSIPHFSRAQMHLVVCVCVGGGGPELRRPLPLQGQQHCRGRTLPGRLGSKQKQEIQQDVHVHVTLW